MSVWPLRERVRGRGKVGSLYVLVSWVRSYVVEEEEEEAAEAEAEKVTEAAS